MYIDVLLPAPVPIFTTPQSSIGAAGTKRVIFVAAVKLASFKDDTDHKTFISYLSDIAYTLCSMLLFSNTLICLTSHSIIYAT